MKSNTAEKRDHVEKPWNYEDETRKIYTGQDMADIIRSAEHAAEAATITDLPVYYNGVKIEYTWTEQQVIGYTQTDVTTTGDLTVFTNALWERPPLEEGKKAPKLAGETLMIFEEYDTPLGVEVTINHVGDCFD